MGNTNNMISAEELEQLSKQSGLSQQQLQKQFNNFKKLDKQNKGKYMNSKYLIVLIYLIKILFIYNLYFNKKVFIFLIFNN